MAADLNCPNCGAPRDGPVCEYCGTQFAPRASDAFLILNVDNIHLSPDEIAKLTTAQGHLRPLYR